MCQIVKPIALIVEDRPEVATIWSRHLEPLNMEVRIAPNLASAKLLAREIPPPDLILLDLRLTDSKDHETLGSIHYLTEQNPDCIVLVLSGFVTADITKLAIEKGAHAVIEKMDIKRAADLWMALQKVLREGPKNTRQRLHVTSDLIERLSKPLLNLL